MILPVLSFRIPGGKAASALLVPEPPPAPDERATVSPSLLTSGSSTTDGSSVATDSVSPGANRALYAAVVSSTGANPVVPTCSGNGLTWTLVTSVAFSGDGDRRLAVFRAMGASPSAGAITFDWAGQTQTSFVWSVVECDGVDTTGSGASGATVQSVTNTAAAATSVTATLAALEHANNLALVFVALDIASTITPDGSFAELSDNNIGPNSTLEAEQAAGETACTATFASANAGVVAIEVKAGPA